MNITWLTKTTNRRIELLNQASRNTGLPVNAIEKDWWVTLVLEACFSLPFSSHLIFKGGTSLSKGWNLIDRFSEDIDIGIDKKFFNFHDDKLSNRKIEKLRRDLYRFVSVEFINNLESKFNEWNVKSHCFLQLSTSNQINKDPHTIEINYQSVLDGEGYLPQKVLVEVGARSLIEPVEQIAIYSILTRCFPLLNFASNPFYIPAALPQKTFLEKVFLLHEEFSKPTDKIRVERLSRHLYDLEKLMDTEHGISALNNEILYKNIVAHREKFNKIKGIDYANHIPEKIRVLPPAAIIEYWERDYQAMKENMIFGKSLSFSQLINRIQELQNRINSLPLTPTSPQ